ncbi:MAG: lipoate--protein ligase family protein [Candidatus Dormibacteria bacterium]
MTGIRLLDVGLCSYTESQTLYHAVASSMGPGDPNTIIICRPRRPYVCIGRHQELHREVDVAACQRLGLPVLRREVGGGAVYLDRDQLFFQLVWHPHEMPPQITEAFEYFARAPVECYRALGISGAHFAPVNDLQVAGRKIGGLGAATIGQAFVFVGSIITAFDARAAASVLRIPDEKLRDKVAQSMEAYVSSLTRELGYRPAPRTVRRELVSAFERTLGDSLVPGELRDTERLEYRRWVRQMRSSAWIDQVRMPPDRLKALRITGNVGLGHAVHKAPGGLLRVTVIVADRQITSALVSGDFYAVGDALQRVEQALLGPADIEAVGDRIGVAWPGAALPGVKSEDLVEAVRLALTPGSWAGSV